MPPFCCFKAPLSYKTGNDPRPYMFFQKISTVLYYIPVAITKSKAWQTYKASYNTCEVLQGVEADRLAGRCGPLR